MFGHKSVEFQVCNILDFDTNYSARELEKLRTSQPFSNSQSVPHAKRLKNKFNNPFQ